MYSMKDCCEMTGLSYDTLKFYCNEGLVPNVKRDKINNYRVFDDNDVNWIKSLICLKKCNFSLKEMRTYISLCQKGKDTIPERQQMLKEHRKQVEEQIKSLNENIAFIDKKNELYNKILSGEIEYFSYLTKPISEKK